MSGVFLRTGVTPCSGDYPIWTVYILKCADDTLYTGIAKDLERRVEQHNDGCGAKYTRVRRPVSVIYAEQQADRSKALKREHSIKCLTRVEKLKLARSWIDT